MFKNLQMQNKELQAKTKADSEQMPIVASPAQMPQNPLLADAVFKPMLFSTPMVQAILEGRKTMTRRIVKAGFNTNNMFFRNIIKYNSKPYDIQAYFSNTESERDWIGTKCPFDIGNIIWVRETFREIEQDFGTPRFEYKATEKINKLDKWKPSLFMPKNACRLFLEITNIKVERIQDITNEDAEAEGLELEAVIDTVKFFKRYSGNNKTWHTSGAYNSFKTLWHKINGVENWEANPFVWVYTFKIVGCPNGFR